MKQNNKKILAVSFGFIVVVAIVTILSINIFTPKEKHISQNNNSTSINALTCKYNGTEDAFFHSNLASNELDEVKITFNDDKIDKISLTYSGEYIDNDTAKKISSEMHAKYNLYMDTTSVGFDKLSPNFSVINAKVIVSLFLSIDTLNAETAKFLFLDENEVRNISNTTINSLKKKYTTKGFSCAES